MKTGKKNIRVLHIDSERTWRGGQQQAAYLLEAMYEKGYETALVCRPGSEFESYCKKNKLPHYSIRMRGEVDFYSGYQIARICRRHGYNILHLHSAHAISTGLWTKLFNRSLILVGVRRVDFHIRNNAFSRYKYKTRMLDRLVCISKKYMKWQ